MVPSSLSNVSKIFGATALALSFVTPVTASAADLAFQGGVTSVVRSVGATDFAAAYNFEVPTTSEWLMSGSFSGFRSDQVPYGATLEGVDLFGPGGSSLSFTNVADNRFDLLPTVLSEGPWTLIVAFTSSPLGGLYAGVLSYTTVATAVATVPEPETYAMLLAGLVAVGFLTRRRQFW